MSNSLIVVFRITQMKYIVYLKCCTVLLLFECRGPLGSDNETAFVRRIEY